MELGWAGKKKFHISIQRHSHNSNKVLYTRANFSLWRIVSGKEFLVFGAKQRSRRGLGEERSNLCWMMEEDSCERESNCRGGWASWD